MDFGEILKKWEQEQGKKSAQTGVKNSDMETWMKDNEVYDKDACMQKKEARGENRRRLLNMPPDEIIDIHGLTSENAFFALDKFFDKAKNNGCKKLRIIHGKGTHSQGDSVLKNTVRDFIEQCDFAGESGFEKAVYGGSGATWVLLK